MTVDSYCFYLRLFMFLGFFDFLDFLDVLDSLAFL